MKLYFTGFGKLGGKPALARLAAGICRRIKKLKGSGEINFILISDKGIKKLHREFLDDPSATDVITFQYPRTRAKKNIADPFGDIYISLDRARAQASASGHDARREVAFLMAHGLLHLAGYTDKSPRQRSKMLALQANLIEKIDPKLAPAGISRSRAKGK